MKTIAAKVTILYIFLAILNTSFFTIIIFENQNDLITENIKLNVEKKATGIYTQLSTLIQEMNFDDVSNVKEEAWVVVKERVLEKLNNQLKNLLENYIIFTENKEVLYKTNSALVLTDINIGDAIRAVSNKEFMGSFYYSRILDEEKKIYFYVPILIEDFEKMILFFPIPLKDINNRMADLYRLVVIIIVLVSVFHIAFGVILHRILIQPIKGLAAKSIEISEGNLAARAEVKRKDEIGQLGNAFNKMASSVQVTIDELNRQNEKMKLELRMAGKVQQSIYPTFRETDFFKVAIYHLPLIEVSGDYHDVFSLGHERYGVLIADVSGHGVAAALITMLIKETFEKIAAKYTDSKECLRGINDELGDLMIHYEKYFTAFYLIVDENRRVCFTNAGHHNAYLLRPGVEKVFSLNTNGCIIGFSKEVGHSFESKEVSLKKGDKLILMTDGVIESMDEKREQYGTKRFLRAAIKNKNLSAEAMMKNMLEDFIMFADRENRKDDETVIIIEITKDRDEKLA